MVDFWLLSLHNFESSKNAGAEEWYCYCSPLFIVKDGLAYYSPLCNSATLSDSFSYTTVS